MYRKGRLSIAVSLSADGNKVVSLAPHKIVTFYLFPGNHELTLQSGEITPSALFKAEAGGEYFFQLDYEHVVSSKSLKGLSVSLSMQPKVINEDEPREVTIDQSKLIDILLKSKLGSEDTPASSPAIIPESPFSTELIHFGVSPAVVLVPISRRLRSTRNLEPSRTGQ